VLVPCIESNIKNCFGASDEHRGFKKNEHNYIQNRQNGVLAEEASDLMKRFLLQKEMIFNDMPQYWLFKFIHAVSLSFIHRYFMTVVQLRSAHSHPSSSMRDNNNRRLVLSFHNLNLPFHRI
jgi:hypothetical protein